MIKNDNLNRIDDILISKHDCDFDCCCCDFEKNWEVRVINRKKSHESDVCYDSVETNTETSTELVLYRVRKG